MLELSINTGAVAAGLFGRGGPIITPPGIPPLPEAATTGSDLSRADAFQAWWFSTDSASAAWFFAQRDSLRIAMGAGPDAAASLNDGTFDPRWDAVNARFRPTSAIAHDFSLLDVPGYILVGSANPLSVGAVNARFDVGGQARFFAYQRSIPFGAYTATFERCEFAGMRTSANDEAGPSVFLRCWAHDSEGDGFKYGKGTSSHRAERCWVEATGVNNSSAHGDGWQVDAARQWIILNCVMFSVAALDDAFPPKTPEYTTGTYGPTNAVIIGPRGADHVCEDGLIAGCVLNHGGYFQIGMGSNEGDIVRNILIYRNIGCHPDFRLAGDTGLESIYPNLDIDHDGVFENIGFALNLMPDGTPMLYKGNDVTGIWRWNPDTLSDLTRDRYIEAGLLDAQGIPLPDMVRSFSPDYDQTPEPPQPVPITHTLLHGFNTQTGTPLNSVLSLHTDARKIEGAGGLRIEGTAANNQQGATNIVTLNTDLRAFHRVAVRVDYGDEGAQPGGGLRTQFVAGGTTYLPTGVNGGIADIKQEVQPYYRGSVWLSWDIGSYRAAGGSAGALLTGVEPLAKQLGVTWNNNTSPTDTARYRDVVLDAAVAIPAGAHKPMVALTFDDVRAPQYNLFRPALDDRGFKATWYVPYNMLRTAAQGMDANYMSMTEMQALAAQGHAMCLDSDNFPLTCYDTVEAAVAGINAQKAQLVADFGAAAFPDHFCYSFGGTGIKMEQSYSSIATVAGDKATLPANNFGFANLSPGMRVFGGGFPAGTVILNISKTGGAAQTLTLSNTGTNGSQTLYFIGAIRGCTVTANGTDTVTITGGPTNFTDKVFAGMRAYGPGVPSGPRPTVLSVAGNVVTFDRVIPSGGVVTRMDFMDSDNPWWTTNVVDALRAGCGLKTGRAGAIGGGFFTGFGGPDPRTAMLMPAFGLPNGTTAAQINAADTLIQRGMDGIYYFHGATPQEMTDLYLPFLDMLKARSDAGLVDVVTIPAMHTAWNGRAPFPTA